MTVCFPDRPGDCPIGMNRSAISCAEAPAATSALIPTTPTRNVRTFIRLPSLPLFGEEGSRRLLLADGLPRVLAAEEYTPGGLFGLPSGFLQVGHGIGVKAAALQHTNAVLGLANGPVEIPPLLLGRGRRPARLQQLDALPDVLERVDDPQEAGDGHDLRPIELDAHAARVGLFQRGARRGIVERVAVVEGDRAFDGLDGVVVEERPAIRRLHQRRNVERPVARRAKPVVARDRLAGQTSGLIGKVLHPRVEVGVPEAAPAEVRRRPGIHMAEVALPSLLSRKIAWPR